MHTQILEVTVDDPIPPSISLGGPLASGQWVSGREPTPNVVVAAQDNAGVHNVTASVGPQIAIGVLSMQCTRRRGHAPIRQPN